MKITYTNKEIKKMDNLSKKIAVLSGVDMDQLEGMNSIESLKLCEKSFKGIKVTEIDETIEIDIDEDFVIEAIEAYEPLIETSFNAIKLFKELFSSMVEKFTKNYTSFLSKWFKTKDDEEKETSTSDDNDLE